MDPSKEAHQDQAPKTVNSIRVLLVEDNPADVRLVRELMADAGAGNFQLTHVEKLGEARALLIRDPFDAVLLDLVLPDARELEALSQISEISPQMPVVVMSGVGDEALALKALQRGAQDYLIKGNGDGELLARSLRYAIERHRTAQQFDHLAHHDPLTNLPNRKLFMDRLEQCLARTRRNRQMLALLFLDLDRFKTVNDTLGHHTGDLVLQEIARRLKTCMRASDTVARLAGDEFALILSEVSRLDDVKRFAGKILEALQPPVTAGGSELRFAASIGISLYPSDEQDAEALLRCADAAMYCAKQKGGSAYVFYQLAMNRGAEQRPSPANELRRALARDELVLYYQPEVNALTGDLIGVEALVRWRHPSQGLLLPPDFIPLAEKTGLLGPLDEWVLEHACAQLGSWRQAGLSGFRLAVNLSSHELRGGSVAEKIERILRDSKVAAADLELELTETGVLRTDGRTVSELNRLRGLGLRVAIDDFGKGYSCLDHLRRFPIDSLKIDRSFIHRIPTRSQDATIVSALIALAHGLRLQVTAEGVETVQELEFLRERGCDQAQGYFFSPPISAGNTTNLLRQGRRWGSPRAKRSELRRP